MNPTTISKLWGALAGAVVTAALALVPNAVSAESVPVPSTGDTKLVQYSFDKNSTFTILTRPEAVTDIQTEPGEQISAFALGDSVNWSTDKITGHVFIKPIRPDLFTSATMVTNKRTYQLSLRSGGTASHWYQQVSWRYPEQEMVQRQILIEDQKKADEERVRLDSLSAGPVFSPSQINFKYTIKGNAPFKPVQVFDDGKFTWLRMENVEELPAIFMDVDGHWELVNFVPKGDYILIQRRVDGLMLKLGDREVTIYPRG